MTTAVTAAAIQPVPPGFRLHLDPTYRQQSADVLTGGVPLRHLRLTPAGARTWAQLQHRPVTTRAEGLLARRLVDAGLVHPQPPDGGPLDTSDVVVVVPVLDRAPSLARCLRAVGAHLPVIVVDDGSVDPIAVAAVAAEHGARLVRRPTNGGPAAARNTGLDAASVAGHRVVAFLDSDCEPPPGWLEPLLAHLADPQVAAVAPRIVGATAGAPTVARRYALARGALDLGPRASCVRADARVAYVPTAALVARVSALHDVARGADAFDPCLRYGEDVDLVWRLAAAGWSVRYQPGVQVAHHEPSRWPALLVRRFRYGTSAVPLAQAHPNCTSPLALAPWPALAVGALVAGRPLPAAGAFAAGVLSSRHRLRRADLPTGGVVARAARSTRTTWLATGRYVTQFAAPAALVLAVAPGRTARRLGAASLLLGGPLAAWWPRRDQLDPLRFTAGYLADEVAYGAGVWSAAVRRRTFTALRPRVARRSYAAPAPRSIPTKEFP